MKRFIFLILVITSSFTIFAYSSDSWQVYLNSNPSILNTICDSNAPQVQVSSVREIARPDGITQATVMYSCIHKIRGTRYNTNSRFWVDGEGNVATDIDDLR